MGETLHTILTWYFHHPSGKSLDTLIEEYWDIIGINDDLNVDDLTKLFLIAAEISTLSLTEGLFYLADVEESYNQTNLDIPREDLINAINQQMKEQRSKYV